jgi:hypothetical protein
LPDLDTQLWEDENEILQQFENSLPVRCGVHTLQVAIMDGLNTPHTATTIGKIRNLAVELRTPKIGEKIKKEGACMAFVDKETR